MHLDEPIREEVWEMLTLYPGLLQDLGKFHCPGVRSSMGEVYVCS